MEQILSLVVGNKAVIFGFLFATSEILALVPGIKANSIFQVIFGFLKSKAAK